MQLATNLGLICVPAQEHKHHAPCCCTGVPVSLPSGLLRTVEFDVHIGFALGNRNRPRRSQFVLWRRRVGVRADIISAGMA